MNEIKELTAEKLKEIMRHEKILIVDVRNEEDYEELHIPDSIFLDQYTFNDFVEEIDKEQMIVIYCYRGNRSKKTALRLINKGFKEVYNLTGGFKEWISRS